MIGPGVGADVAVGVDVGHHVVPQLPLVARGRLEVDVVDVGLELGDLLAVIGRPSSASASASATHSRRQVLNFRAGSHSLAHLAPRRSGKSADCRIVCGRT